MSGPKPPLFDEIRSLIARADEVCRESEMLRAQAERNRQRLEFWPDRRRRPRKYRQDDGGKNEGGSTPEGNEGTL